MTISLLRIQDFRNLASAELLPCAQGLNIICGDNGSGKTSILESLYYLGLGRSFRSSNLNRLIRHQTDKFSIFTQLVNSEDWQYSAGVERAKNGQARWRFGEKDVQSVAEVASFLPMQIINSQSHNIFEAGPIFRRKYIDWGLFYYTDSFLPCWRYFERVLKQRNSVLREKRPKAELAIWTNEFINYAMQFDALRRDYINALTPFVLETAKALLPITDLTLVYEPGWPDEQTLTEVLAASYFDELRCGFTQYGPHRADIDIRVNAVPAKHFLSRGQQKLLICAIIVAQGLLLTKCTNKRLIYLIDDLPSELDAQGRQRLLSLLLEQKAQIFVTAIEKETVCLVNEKNQLPIKVFHVEHGRVEERSA